jgi:FHS family L-fucose permease-like MFS transporter
MVWTFIIQYADHLGINKAKAQMFNIVAMSLNLSGRFIGTSIMRFVNTRMMLTIFGICAALCTVGTICIEGMAGLYCLVAISACMSLMFPTIYGIALQGLGDDAKFGAAGLIMAILGGSVLPPLQASIIDQVEVFGMPAVNVSFVLPFICFLVIIVYGVRCAKTL